MLENISYKLQNQQEIRVTFLGGSITVGVGSSDWEKTSWRALVTQWLRKTYSQSNIEVFNEAVSGKGSTLGVCKVAGGLLERQKPDLLFLEYAINDRHECRPYSVSECNMESMIRMVRKRLPYTDIVLVYTSDDIRNGTPYDAILAFETVAKHYGVPSVDVGQELVRQEGNCAFENSGKYLSDNVHPNDAGHAHYASYVIEFLKKTFAFRSDGMQPYPLPEPLCDGLYTTGQRMAEKEFFAVASEISRLHNKGREECGFLLPPGEKLVFRFQGRVAELSWKAPADALLTVTINGSSRQMEGVPWGSYPALFEDSHDVTQNVQLENSGKVDLTLYEMTTAG